MCGQRVQCIVARQLPCVLGIFRTRERGGAAGVHTGGKSRAEAEAETEVEALGQIFCDLPTHFHIAEDLCDTIKGERFLARCR